MKDRIVSPLGIIALFLSFSETVLGVAVLHTQGGIQIALTWFVIGFPIFVSTIFFLILWHRNWVFYSPKQFKESRVEDFVQAMGSRAGVPQRTRIAETTIKLLEAKIHSFEATLNQISDPKEQAALMVQEAISIVRESIIIVDSRPLLGEDGRIWEESCDPDMMMGDFLDSLYSAMKPLVPPYTYGFFWMIRTVGDNRTIREAGRTWAVSVGRPQDNRTLGELGLTGGNETKIEIVRP